MFEVNTLSARFGCHLTSYFRVNRVYNTTLCIVISVSMVRGKEMEEDDDSILSYIIDNDSLNTNGELEIYERCCFMMFSQPAISAQHQTMELEYIYLV